jgi:hypothetical protein
MDDLLDCEREHYTPLPPELLPLVRLLFALPRDGIDPTGKPELVEKGNEDV